MHENYPFVPGLKYGFSLYLHPYFVLASSEGTGETEPSLVENVLSPKISHYSFQSSVDPQHIQNIDAVRRSMKTPSRVRFEAAYAMTCTFLRLKRFLANKSAVFGMMHEHKC